MSLATIRCESAISVSNLNNLKKLDDRFTDDDYLIIDPDSSHACTVCCISAVVLNSVCSMPTTMDLLPTHDADSVPFCHTRSTILSSPDRGTVGMEESSWVVD